jgi:hypothetical protein
VRRRERVIGLEATPLKSAWKLRRMLDDHPVFVRMLADVALAGHGVVYVMGNHDREFHFPEVQAVLTAAIRDDARARGRDLPADPVRYEPWFFHVPGEIYVEHGNQYDYYSSFKWLLAPTIEQPGREPVLALPMGNLSNRVLLTRMGFFNPHATDFILNLYRYGAHWLRHYAFTRRRLLAPWLWGSIRVMARLLATKGRVHRRPADLDDRVREVSQRSGVPVATLARLARLHRDPITHRFYRIVREFWIDRLLMAIVMTGGTIALALVPIPLWIKLMVPLSCFPLLYFVYERAVHGEDVNSAEKVSPSYARAVEALLPVRVVTFGHTHRPKLVPLERGVSFVDTGAWAPITSSTDRTTLVPGYRNFLVVAFDGRGEPSIRLDCGPDHAPEPGPEIRLPSRDPGLAASAESQTS